MDLAKLKTLVVDDMSSMRMTVKAVLREHGIVSVHEAGNGARALELLAGDAFELVICDWEMPNVSGLEVLQQLRAQPDTAALPFIMLTANADRDHVRRAIEAGVSDFLTKPFKATDLINKIHRALRRSQVRHAEGERQPG
jgi:CheY-like chemotaxis protein